MASMISWHNDRKRKQSAKIYSNSQGTVETLSELVISTLWVLHKDGWEGTSCRENGCIWKKVVL